MTPADFRHWKAALGLTVRGVASSLGIAPNTVTKYTRDGAVIPRYVALACAAVARGIQPWPE
jgi:transcriptional regulator with XRE-family HTH domain